MAQHSMHGFSKEDTAIVLQECCNLYCRISKPSPAIRGCMRTAAVVGNEILDQKICSNELVGRYIHSLTQCKILLREIKVNLDGSYCRFLKRRAARKLDRDARGLQTSLTEMRGDLHVKLNVLRSATMASPGAIPVLVATLGQEPAEKREAAARKLADLAVDVHAGRSIANAGGISMFIKMLEDSISSSQALAIRALGNLTQSDFEHQLSILHHSGMEVLINRLYARDASVQEAAACCIANMTGAYNVNMKEVWVNAIEGLMHASKASTLGNIHALRAVGVLSKHEEMRDVLIAAGVVRPLLMATAKGCHVLADIAGSALARLSIKQAHSVAIMNEGGVGILLAGMASSLTVRCKENLSCVLANISSSCWDSIHDNKAWESATLMFLSKMGTVSGVFTRNALLCLAHLSRRTCIQEAIVKAGGIPRLLVKVKSENVATRQRALITVANVVGNRKLAKIVHPAVAHDNGVEILTALIAGASGPCREQGCQALARLTSSKKLHDRLRTAGSVAALIRILADPSASSACVGFATCALAYLSASQSTIDEIDRLNGHEIIRSLANSSNSICQLNCKIILERCLAAQ